MSRRADGCDGVFATVMACSRPSWRAVTLTGQERFGNMTRVYYKEAVGAFIVFDVTRASTFEAVQKWKNDLDSKVTLADGTPVPCVLLANKVGHARRRQTTS